MRDNWSIKFVTDWDEIYSPDFQGKWLFWAENAVNGHVFFHPALCMAWIDTYRPIRKLEPYFCIAENETGTVFLPLVLWHKNWKNGFQKILEPIGGSDFDYHDPLVTGCFEQSDLPMLWDKLLPYIKEKLILKVDMIVIGGVRQKGNQSNWMNEGTSYSINNLSAITEENLFIKTLTGSLRGDIRRQIRRLSEQGEVSFYEYSFDFDDSTIKNKLSPFLDAQKERWPKSYQAPGFHHRLIAQGIKSSIVSFSELRLNLEPISWHLGFRWQGVFYYYMPAISANHYPFSPGKIHLYKLIVDNIKRGTSTFDLLKGSEQYKLQWANEFTYTYKYSETSTRAISKIRNFINLRFKSLLRSILNPTISNSQPEIKTGVNVRMDERSPIELTRKNKWEEVLDPGFQELWYSFYKDSNSNHVFFHPALAHAWIQTYRSIRNISPIFYIFEFKMGKILFPLFLWKRNWKNGYQKIIIPLGYGDFDYGDPILIGKIEPYEKREFWQAIISDLKSSVTFDAIKIPGIHQYESYFDSKDIISTTKCPFINLRGIKEVEVVGPIVSTKVNKEIQRRIRRLGELGKIEFYNYDSENLNTALDELKDMLAVHAKHWPKSYKAIGYHSNLILYGLKEGIVHFSTIKLNGTTISWRLGFILNKRYYSYMPAYKPEYKKFSPGKIHLDHCIKYAIEHDCEVYDLLSGSEKYKDEWATGYDLVSKIEIKNTKLSSRFRNAIEVFNKRLRTFS